MASTGTPATGAQRPPAPDMGNQLVVMMALIVAMFVMFDNNLRLALGRAVGFGLDPLVGFDGRLPVMTLLITGLLMSFFSIVVRHFFVDWVAMARNQRITSAFQKELREARAATNTYKLKKLTELQPQIMAQSLKSTSTQMKLMPVTMVVVIPIFAWLANFIYITVTNTTSTSISVPWALDVDMKGSNILPNWVLLYSVLTLPFSQVLTRGLKYFSFTRRLKKFENEEFSPTPRTEG